MEKYDLIIVGAGPAGIFTAVELLRHGSKKKILLVEKGKPVEKRHCPKAEVGHCVNCRPTCAITGVPDPIRGMVVKATVVLKDEYKSMAGPDLIKKLQDHVKHETAPYKYPRIIEFVDELPKTISGKIRRVREVKRAFLSLFPVWKVHRGMP